MITYPVSGVVGGDIWLTSATPVALASPETCTDSGDHTTYQTSEHFAWSWVATFTVQCSADGSTDWSTVTDYFFQWATGKLIFKTARVPGTNAFVRISAGSYFTASRVGGAYSYTSEVMVKVQDTTQFQAEGGWQQNAPVIKSATAKIQTFRNDDYFFQVLGKLVLIQLFLNKQENVRWQFFAIPQKPAITADVTKIETQSVDFTSVRGVYFLTS